MAKIIPEYKDDKVIFGDKAIAYNDIESICNKNLGRYIFDIFNIVIIHISIVGILLYSGPDLFNDVGGGNRIKIRTKDGKEYRFRVRFGTTVKRNIMRKLPKDHPEFLP